MNSMFRNCTSLVTIYAGSGFTTDTVTSSTTMFYGCTNIKGSANTGYNKDITDKTYAHIDGGTSNPGYFTAKS